ncbi:uncharacterized protein BDR25DRAFT_82927 [Lindgomyces ingoldianus]|uniref:Uncharacterized protein n=1 Tax=Lindgomyces ingoldianus TaxID=673940 RepID=A0ACB6QGT4_9PLEO|nr:uncharacterized protein BDR25DRAFT_82927 [Lindgomyces ingoldianus]KAF2465773.1 hypothetical protein BDR25DRAFT_82927 [Lindgomyces ingoldianus]
MTKNWDEVHEIIRKLYVIEGRPLSEVRKVLQADHGFYAHERSFRIKLSDWHFTRASRRSTNSRPSTAGSPSRTLTNWSDCLRTAIEHNRSYELNMILEGTSSRPMLLDDGMPPIHYAATCGSSQLVFQALLDHRADINELYFHDGQKRSVLQAILLKRLKTLRSSRVCKNIHRSASYLISRGAKLHPGGTGERPAFDMLIDPWRTDPEWYLTGKEDEWSCLGSFLSNGAIIQTPFQSRRCLLQNAQTFQHVVLCHTDNDTARFIINHATVFHEGNGSSLLSELVKGCQNLHSPNSGLAPELLQALLDKGADPNALDDAGRTPLMNLLRREAPIQPEILLENLARLVKSGADPFKACSSGETPIMCLRNHNIAGALGLEIADILLTGLDGTHLSWTASYFPITNEWEKYLGNTPFWDAVHENLPENIANGFAKAALSVSTWLYLEKYFPAAESPDQTWEILEVLKLREAEQFLHYEISEKSVMKLMGNLMIRMERDAMVDLKYGMISGQLQQNPLQPLPSAFTGGVFQDSDMTYMCPICPAIPGVYLENWQLKDHYEQHDHPFVCGQRHCEKRFKSQEELDDHDVTHHWHLCDYTLCGKRFKAQSELEQHKQELQHRFSWEDEAGLHKSRPKRNPSTTLRPLPYLKLSYPDGGLPWSPNHLSIGDFPEFPEAPGV